MNNLYEETFRKYENYVYECSKFVKQNTKVTLGMDCAIIDERGISFSTDEDLFQEGRLALWEGINLYFKTKKIREKQNEEIEKYNNKLERCYSKVDSSKRLVKLKPKKKAPISGPSTYLFMYLRCVYLNLNTKVDGVKDTKTGYYKGANKWINKQFELEYMEEYGELDVLMNKSSMEFTLDIKRELDSLMLYQKEIFIRYFFKKWTKEKLKKTFPLYNIDKEITFLRDKFERSFRF